MREYDAVTGAAVQALEISRALGLGKYVDLLREVRAQAPADEPALAELDEALRSA